MLVHLIQGKFYFFERQESGWVEIAKVRLPGPGFGNAVALNGNTAIVGATTGDKVYVFKRFLGQWIQTHKIIPSDVEDNDRFGSKVAVDGNTLIAASREEDFAGKVYVYVKIGTQWIEQAILKPDDIISDDWFGSSLGISGDTAIVGAQWDQDGGSAYIFKRIGTNWIQWAKLTPRDAKANIDFGSSCAIDGDFAVVGSRFNGPGAAYLFKRIGFRWVQIRKLTASDGQFNDYFGFVSDISGDQLIVGAHLQEEDFFVPDAGAAYIYDFSEIN